MHNCKTTRIGLIDLALDELQASERKQLLTELGGCAECQEEYAALSRALRTTHQAIQSTAPLENFWPGYHSRLSDRIRNLALADSAATLLERAPVAGLSLKSRLRQVSRRVGLALGRIAGASVRIPVPVAAVIVLCFGLSLFLVIRVRGQVTGAAATRTPLAIVETRTIEVPISKEKVITRVVYLEKDRKQAGMSTPRGARSFSNTVAQDRKELSGKTAAVYLSGFKPADEVKLTIIKGSFHDEK
jgi:hypothetical protein